MSSLSVKIKGTLIGIQGNIMLLDIGDVKTPLEVGNDYTLNIKNYRNDRSLLQNAQMWSLITEIAKHTGNETNDVYCSGLESANVVYDFLLVLPEVIPKLKNSFRAVKDMQQEREVNGKILKVVKVFIGSSKYDEDEMKTLIDYFLYQKEILGIK